MILWQHCDLRIQDLCKDQCKAILIHIIRNKSFPKDSQSLKTKTDVVHLFYNLHAAALVTTDNVSHKKKKGN